MRWSDTRQEAVFFGVNYTLPFAHAYRSMGYLGVDRKQAIDRDVYHLARLGINAYRIHVWDVEVSDAEGNLLENEHLDLLDYLIYKLQERGIRTFITAQTDFGNGYPEHNEPTGGFAYNYDKCSIHSNADAIAAQERYIGALVSHLNPYTGHAYKDDPFIVGFEVNNEPCHAGTEADTRAYINRMLRALKRAGNRKPVFYNVSHNPAVTQAYYDTPIQGTTYQWYPIGLVSGHTRKGNFLPFVDRYDIPFAHLKGFDRKARMVYEFDPADILYSYLYPATVRTFRTAGFQWMTQFAYDPLDMAAYNTEYQTHYLNVAYTPGKAIGLMIAAEVAQAVGRGETFGSYPADTLFHDCRVSYANDLSEWNDGEKFYYSNTTTTRPKAINRLQSIAGCGSSPVVRYEGTGIYWIDRLEAGVWRLEVMPDAVVVSDPFAKPALDKEVVRILANAWDMQLDLPDLGKCFRVTGLNEGNTCNRRIEDGNLSNLRPGVYLLQREGISASGRWTADTFWNHIRLGEYVQPVSSASSSWSVVHTPLPVTDAGKALQVEAVIAGTTQPDSVLLYDADRISFWNEYNPYIKMQRADGYRYVATVPAATIKGGCFRYNLVICKDGSHQTFPAGVAKSPLDWDYTAASCWETEVVSPQSPVRLMDVRRNASDTEIYMLPEWDTLDRRTMEATPTENPFLSLTFKSQKPNPAYFLHRYVKEEVQGRLERLSACRTLCVQLKDVPEGLRVGFVTATGYTYLAACPAPDADGVARIPLAKLEQTETALLPCAYPIFLDKYFRPQTALPFRIEEVETLELRMEGAADRETAITVGGIWLE